MKWQSLNLFCCHHCSSSFSKSVVCHAICWPKHEPRRNQSSKAYKWNRNRVHKSRPVSRHTVCSVHVQSRWEWQIARKQSRSAGLRKTKTTLLGIQTSWRYSKRGAYVPQSEILSNARFWNCPESHVAFASLLADQTVPDSWLLSAEEMSSASMSAVCTTLRNCLLVERSASH